jgi:hypothetical protein
MHRVFPYYLSVTLSVTLSEIPSARAAAWQAAFAPGSHAGFPHIPNGSSYHIPNGAPLRSPRDHREIAHSGFPMMKATRSMEILIFGVFTGAGQSG